MSEISAADVKKLRDRTGMQMMKCKAALTEAGGDMEKAVELLRKQNKDAQDKAASRETTEGRIGVYIDNDARIGAIIEVRCESAPVAKNELFIKLTAGLHNRIPGDTKYLGMARGNWNWFVASGMINGQGLINDGLDTISCQNNGAQTWTYNQGVVLGALVELNRATGDATLLQKARQLADASTTSSVKSAGPNPRSVSITSRISTAFPTA